MIHSKRCFATQIMNVFISIITAKLGLEVRDGNISHGKQINDVRLQFCLGSRNFMNKMLCRLHLFIVCIAFRYFSSIFQVIFFDVTFFCIWTIVNSNLTAKPISRSVKRSVSSLLHTQKKRQHSRSCGTISFCSCNVGYIIEKRWLWYPTRWWLSYLIRFWMIYSKIYCRSSHAKSKARRSKVEANDKEFQSTHGRRINVGNYPIHEKVPSGSTNLAPIW